MRGHGALQLYEAAVLRGGDHGRRGGGQPAGDTPDGILCRVTGPVESHGLQNLPEASIKSDRRASFSTL